MNRKQSEKETNHFFNNGEDATEILIRSKLKYQSLFEHMNTGFVYLKVEKDQKDQVLDFIVLECNSAFKRIAGLTKRYLIGEKVSKLFNFKMDWYAAIFQNVRKVTLTGEPIQIETYYKKYHKYLSYSVYYPCEGYVEFLINDITEFKDIKELKRISMYFSARFINTPVEKIDDEIDNALYEIGQFYDAERCCIFHYSERKNSFECTNQWDINDLEQSVRYKKINLDKFEWLINEIRHDRIVKLSRLNELPEEAVNEKECFACQGYQSLLFLPITYEEKVFGAIELITFHYEKVWTFEQIDLLKFICNIFASAIKRKAMDEALQCEIDKLVKLKQVLKDSEEKYRKLTISIQDGIIMLDSEGRIVNWNKAAENIFGYTHREVAGRSLHQLVVPPDKISRAERNYSRFIETGEGKYANKTTQIHAVKKDGSRFVAELSTSTIKLKGSMHVVGIIRDISERREIQRKMFYAMEAAQAASQAKSQFLANISHEIRTPMNGIIGFLDLLAKTSCTRQQYDYITEIKTASNVLLNLINDLLDFSKIEANKQELDIIDFNLRKLLEEVTSLFSVKAYAKGIEIYAKIDNELPAFVSGDPGKLRQVMENLISNAVKFTGKGRVTLKAKLKSQSSESVTVLFRVTDTGIGISEQDMNKLFDPFTQADASTTRKYGGTGLGLAISEKLVEMMNGKISVESIPGEGTVFSFEIRFGKSSGKTMTPQMFDWFKGLRVLIADKDRINRKIVRYYLEYAGCEVMEAEYGRDIIRLLREAAEDKKPIPLVLMNHEMRDQDGLELAERIKADRFLSDTVINIFTHYANPCDRKETERNGVSELIYKPAYQKDLYNAILVSLGKSEYVCLEKSESTDPEVIIDKALKNHAKLLLVEDNITNQKLAVSILMTAGLFCDIAENGTQALDAMKGKKYDLVLMDCQMPVMDGYEATRMIRMKEDVHTHIPVIAMTANVLRSDIEQCMASGMDDYISKPFKADELLHMIAKWLDSSASQAKTENLNTTDCIGTNCFAEDTDAGIRKALDQLALDQKIDREEIYEIYNEFVDMIPDYIVKIQAAVNACDFEKIRISAHTMKGAAATLRLSVLSNIAAELEKKSKDREISVCRIYLEQIIEYSQENIKQVSCK